MHLIHDIRLVFLAIRACIEEIRRRPGNRLPAYELAKIDHLVETGLSLIAEVFGGPLTPVPSADVNDTLEELQGILMTIAGRDIGVSLKLAKGDTRVSAQRADLERILLNVVFNAVAAMSSGGTLLIDTELVGRDGAADSRSGNLLMTIRDTGTGMSDSQLVSAINPLATPKPDGTGLGLASVALVLTQLGGTLSIESEPGRGTKVSILMPLANAWEQVH